MLDRQEWLKRGRREFSGRTLLFVLPILGPGGGANVVINERTGTIVVGGRSFAAPTGDVTGACTVFARPERLRVVAPWW